MEEQVASSFFVSWGRDERENPSLKIPYLAVVVAAEYNGECLRQLNHSNKVNPEIDATCVLNEVASQDWIAKCRLLEYQY
ncbi:unnamed protein product, partial [Sphenostylis stenocarpa]